MVCSSFFLRGREEHISTTYCFSDGCPSRKSNVHILLLIPSSQTSWYEDGKEEPLHYLAIDSRHPLLHPLFLQSDPEASWHGHRENGTPCSFPFPSRSKRFLSVNLLPSYHEKGEEFETNVNLRIPMGVRIRKEESMSHRERENPARLSLLWRKTGRCCLFSLSHLSCYPSVFRGDEEDSQDGEDLKKRRPFGIFFSFKRWEREGRRRKGYWTAPLLLPICCCSLVSWTVQEIIIHTDWHGRRSRRNCVTLCFSFHILISPRLALNIDTHHLHFLPFICYSLSLKSRDFLVKVCRTGDFLRWSRLSLLFPLTSCPVFPPCVPLPTHNCQCGQQRLSLSKKTHNEIITIMKVWRESSSTDFRSLHQQIIEIQRSLSS